MEQSELELLKKVLPDGYTVVNEGVVEGGQDLVAVWNGDDWQHPIAHYPSAREVINKIVETEKAWSESWGKSTVQHDLMKTLGITDRMNSMRDQLLSEIDKKRK